MYELCQEVWQHLYKIIESGSESQVGSGVLDTLGFWTARFIFTTERLQSDRPRDWDTKLYLQLLDLLLRRYPAKPPVIGPYLDRWTTQYVQSHRLAPKQKAEKLKEVLQVLAATQDTSSILQSTWVTNLERLGRQEGLEGRLLLPHGNLSAWTESNLKLCKPDHAEYEEAITLLRKLGFDVKPQNLDIIARQQSRLRDIHTASEPICLNLPLGLILGEEPEILLAV